MSLRDDLIVALDRVPRIDLIFSDEGQRQMEASGDVDEHGMTSFGRWLEGHSADSVLTVMESHGLI